MKHVVHYNHKVVYLVGSHSWIFFSFFQTIRDKQRVSFLHVAASSTPANGRRGDKLISLPVPKLTFTPNHISRLFKVTPPLKVNPLQAASECIPCSCGRCSLLLLPQPQQRANISFSISVHLSWSFTENQRKKSHLEYILKYCRPILNVKKSHLEYILKYCILNVF